MSSLGTETPSVALEPRCYSAVVRRTSCLTPSFLSEEIPTGRPQQSGRPPARRQPQIQAAVDCAQDATVKAFAVDEQSWGQPLVEGALGSIHSASPLPLPLPGSWHTFCCPLIRAVAQTVSFPDDWWRANCDVACAAYCSWPACIGGCLVHRVALLPPSCTGAARWPRPEITLPSNPDQAPCLP